MNPLIADFIDYVQNEHASTRYERHPAQLCEALDIEYCSGPCNMAHFGPPSMVVVRPEEFGSRLLFTVGHEVAHILMRRGGFHRRILRDHASVPNMKQHVEKLADFAAGLLVMPEPEVREARQLFGETPAAVLHLMSLSGASEAAAMRRWAWQDPTACRGVFVTQGNYISDLSACNMRLPVSRWERVPEVTLQHPEVAASSVGFGRVMGVVAW